jgi:hypothetical protein
MAQPLWANNGSVLYSPLLSAEVDIQAQPELRFVEYCEDKEAWGKNAGETFLYDIVTNIDTQGGKIVETATIPEHGYTINQGTATLYEFANAIPWTRKYSELSQVNVRKVPTRLLADDYAKVIDTTAELQFNQTRVRYVATGTAAGVWSTTGTATATCSNSLNTTHHKTIIDYMYQTLKCPPYNGSDYMAICSTGAKRGIYDDCEDIMMYTKFPEKGEFGRYYDCRFVRTNHALSDAMGSGSVYGEAYYFGGRMDPVCRGMAVRMEVRQKEPGDYGRSKGLAWYTIQGFDLRNKHNPDSTVVKYTTNGDNIT